jgi:hypothetical protein
MKRILITATLIGLSTTAAHAEIDVNIGIGQPGYYTPAPVYIEPAPIYVQPYYGNDRHRNYDWSYWRTRNEAHYVEQHHDDRDGDRRYEMRHDNGNRSNHEHRGNSGHGNGKGKGHKD